MPIKRTEGGGWEVSVCINRQRVHRRLAPGTAASEAKRVEAEIRAALGRQRAPVVPGDPNLTEVMALYAAHAKTLRSPATAEFHALRIGQWAEKYRASQAVEAARHIIDDMTGAYKPATINRSLGALKKGLRLAWEKGRTPVDYSGLIKRLPENNARRVTLTMEEVSKLADHASDAVRAAIWIGLFTGCRRGEILAMQAADIGAHAITIHAGNTKTLRMRSVPIIPPVRPWLARVPLGINFEGLKSGFRRAREASGMPHVTFHDLRRSCGTLLVRQGVPLHVVSKILGHSSTAVTERVYAHLDDQQLYAGLNVLSDLHHDMHQKADQLRKALASA